MMKKFWWKLALVLLSVFVVATVAQAEIVVIANEAVPIDSLNQNEMKDIFLGKTAKWSDKSRVRFAVLTGETHQDFLRAYIKRTPSQYRTYWKKMVFTGKAAKPKSFKSEADLVKYVSQTDGAIGYISGKTDANGAKVLAVN